MTGIAEKFGGAFDTARAGLVAFGRTGFLHPGHLFPLVRAGLQHGTPITTGIGGAALGKPHAVAIHDDNGSITNQALLESVLSISRGLHDLGVGEGSKVAILCRNHRGFVQATAAVDRIGATAIFMNTGFAGPQLSEVLEREGTETLIYDDEFSEVVEAGAGKLPRFLAWHDGTTDQPSLDSLAAAYPPVALPKPGKSGGYTILTSGTTGTPKGASRSGASAGPDTLIGILEKLPIRTGAVTLVSAPAFHSWGLIHTMMGLLFSTPLVMQRRFDPKAVLAAIEQHRVDTLVVVPVMMQRILELGPDVCKAHDTSSLRAVYASGSALPGELALRWMDTFGDNLYNFYGSTEAATTSIALPEDLRSAPGTAGRPPRGTVVKIIDQDGKEVSPGTTGRIFVANSTQFEGYTGGGNKQIIDGLMSIGDLGYFDEDGRLFVEGRDDDMIVSGGENVFPREVEDLLADQPQVAEAAVIGVEDEKFGQRLRAFVVLMPDEQLDEATIKELVKNRLARHKVPRDVVYLDELPRNPTGKVLKRVLREHP
jgi:fatty-acyl-CoA synthase